MKIVITGSLGHISKHIVKTLVAGKHDVVVVSSKPEKVLDIEALGAEAAIGSVEDVAFLTETFTGAHAVYTMVPPNFAAQDWKGYNTQIGKNYAEAIKASGVKNVVNLSSIGAHMPEGAGPVSGLHHAEQALSQLHNINLVHLRPGYFYYNLLNNIGMIKHAGIMGSNCGENISLPMSATEDIAEVAAIELQKMSHSGKNIAYLVSDERKTDKIAQILGKAIGKPDLKWLNFTDQDSVNGMIQAGIPSEVAKGLTEMGAAQRSGAFYSEYRKHIPKTFGKTKLEEYAETFAAMYNHA